MAYFPFFTNIEKKNCVIIGGGKIALGKAEKLLDFHPTITVVAPEISEELMQLPNIRCINDVFSEKYLEKADFVIAATDNSNINHRVFAYCNQNDIPINTVDDPEKCTFIFPSIIHRGDLTIAICSGGKSPFVTKFLRKQAEMHIPSYMDIIIQKMSEIREQIKPLCLSAAAKNTIYESVLFRLLESKGCLSNDEIKEIVTECLK